MTGMYENIDEKLVNLLIEDGRASLRELAEELDVSVTTVRNHIDELEESGVIDGYSANIDYEQMGYDVTAFFNLKVQGDDIESTVETVRSQEQIVSAHETTGEFDIVAIGRFEDTDDMNDHIKSVIATSDVVDSSTGVVLSTAKENEQFAVPVDD
jgi:DNA-binding Lrp family transcriptional regulator